MIPKIAQSIIKDERNLMGEERAMLGTAHYVAGFILLRR